MCELKERKERPIVKNELKDTLKRTRRNTDATGTVREINCERTRESQRENGRNHARKLCGKTDRKTCGQKERKKERKKY